jgi:benzoate-CoA ligase
VPNTLNFAKHLFDRNTLRAQKTAYVDDVNSLSYGQLELRSRQFAAGLVESGMRREERLFIVAHDTNAYPVTFLGALFAGVVPVCANTLLSADDYAYMLGVSGARAIVVSPALWPVMSQAIKIANFKGIVISDRAQPLEGSSAQTVMQYQPLAECVNTNADDIAFWLWSSGSTGRPKGTVHTHGNLLATAQLYGEKTLGVRETDIVYSAAKLFFAYGLGNALTFPLYAGATAVLMAERPTPAAVFQRLKQHRPTVFCGVPTLYAAMLASPELPQSGELALRICTSAGEALPKEIGERWMSQLGSEILDGIGSTEMLHIFLSNRSGEVRYGTTGKAVAGYELELRAEDGRNLVAPGEIGDLFVKGLSAALMYWSNRDKSRTTFQGEWTKSGDKYSVDAEGYYTYAGRSDDMLKVSGQYVSPFEVESALMTHAAVLEAAVVGANDSEGLVKPRAFVVLRGGRVGDDTMAAELKAHVKARLTPHKYPRWIEFVNELPKTATGKIQRFKLRA